MSTIVRETQAEKKKQRELDISEYNKAKYQESKFCLVPVRVNKNTMIFKKVKK